MIRVLIGSAAAAVAMFVVGFIFFATPLAKLGSGTLGNAEAAAIQQSLAANLPHTGTYTVPSTDTPEQSVMYGQGPIATIHYNSAGFAGTDPGALIGGLVLDLVTMLLVGAALLGISGAVPEFGSRARLVVLFSLAAGAYMHLGEPIWLHHDVPHFVYLFIGDVAAMITGGLVIARWFLPRVSRSAE